MFSVATHVAAAATRSGVTPKALAATHSAAIYLEAGAILLVVMSKAAVATLSVATLLEVAATHSAVLEADHATPSPALIL